VTVVASQKKSEITGGHVQSVTHGTVFMLHVAGHSCHLTCEVNCLICKAHACLL